MKKEKTDKLRLLAKIEIFIKFILNIQKEIYKLHIVVIMFSGLLCTNTISSQKSTKN